MVDLGEAISNINPFAKSSTGGPSVAATGFHWIGYILVFIMIASVIGVGLYILLRWLKFNLKIEVYKDVGGHRERVKVTRAMVVPFGRVGDTCIFVRKPKKYLPRPEKQMGRNLYWFFIREDGEWINFVLGDIDMQMRRAGAKYLDEEMRSKRLGLDSIMKERAEKKNFLKEYAPILIPLIAISIIMIFLYLNMDKQIQLAQQNDANAEKLTKLQEEVADKLISSLSSLDRICTSGGSGYTTAPINE